ncbi:MAG: glycosyltransferase family 39 protein [Chloroflexi bacterium]|nr:glycosyltransferase family 39 protein [Chloroflexota bacterium]
MKQTRPYIVLFLIALAFRVATALPLEQAGYMDASYTLHIAEQLARGRGFAEEIIWNYLDQPAGLPHPSNAYWMPLPALLIAPLFMLFGVSYRIAQIPFMLLSSLLPLFAFYLSRKIFSRDDYAWSAALFTLFSGFYTIYWVSPDNFTVYAVTASACLFFIARGIEQMNARDWVIAGILAGLSHLARADGVLLLAIAPLALVLHKPTRTIRSVLLFTVYCSLAYLLVMFPWFARNLTVLGAPLPSAGAKTVWLTNYDELFRYADDLMPARYVAWGLGNILGSKVNAALQNFFIFLFSSPILFLAPLMVIGGWRARHRVEVIPFALHTLVLFLVMTFVFTFPSWRGTVFHSGAALVPFFAVLAPPGIDAAVQWITRRRRAWNATQAALVFRWGFVAIAALFSVYLYAGALVGGTGNIPAWNQRDAEYASIGRWLDQHARADDVVMVVDPPNFFNVTHRRAIVTPTDNVDAIFVAAKRYGARYLVLQFDHPSSLRDLYRGKTTIPGLSPIAEFRDGMSRTTKLFEIIP